MKIMPRKNGENFLHYVFYTRKRAEIEGVKIFAPKNDGTITKNVVINSRRAYIINT